MRLRPRLLLSHGLIIVWMVLVFPLTLFAIHQLGALAALASQDSRAIEATDRIRRELGDEIVSTLRSPVGTAGDATTQPPPPPARAAIDAARSFYATPGEREAFKAFCELALKAAPSVLQTIINRPIYPSNEALVR